MSSPKQNLKTLRRVFSDQTGSTTAETAICLCIVFLLVIGYIFFIETYRTATIMEHAAAEGARYSAIYDSTAGLNKAEEILSAGGVNWLIGDIPSVFISGRAIITMVTTNFRIPFAGNGPNNITIQRRTELLEEKDLKIYGFGEETKGYTGNPYKYGW